MTDLVIVGHGTSLKGSGLGHTIDSYDCPIVRFNGFMHGCGVEDRGSRVDYMCTTPKQFHRVRKDGVIPTRELWVYVPKSVFTISEPYEDSPLYIDHLLWWLDKYRKLRTGKTVHFFCKGLAGVIIAAKRLDVSSILLFGYDNLWRGERENFETMGLGRKKGVYTTLHDYVAERKLLDMVSRRYKVTISHVDMWDIKWAK